MSNFTFTCPHCNQEIEAKDEWRGQQANCPTCNEVIVIPIEVTLKTIPTPLATVPKSGRAKKTPIAIGVLAVVLFASVLIPTFLKTSLNHGSPTNSNHASPPIDIEETSIINFETYLVTNSNEEVTPFTTVQVFKPNETWDKEIIDFNDGLKRISHPGISRMDKSTIEMGLLSPYLIAGQEWKAGNGIGSFDYRTRHFKLTGVNPGTYILLVDAKWNDNKVLWLKKIEKRHGIPLDIKLTNSDSCFIH